MKRFVLVSLFALSSVALADVDVETAPAIKARSTLAPAGEVETYRFDAATGTKLSFSLVQASKKTPLVFSPSLDFGEQQISLNGFTLTSNGFAVKNIVLPHSGEYQLRVSATGTGDYSLTLATTPQTKWSGTLTLGAGATKTFAFSAPPGSSVALSAKPAKGSGATPTFGTLSGGGFETSLSGAKASAQNLTGTGDYLVQVTNGGAAGDVTVAVLVKTPKVKQTKLDLRGARFGKPQGGESVVTRTVGAAGGFVAVSDPASDLDGASVSIPEGALATTLPISVVSSTTPRIPTPGVQAAGPAVDLEPSGTTFGLPVTVTLPFDFSRLPPDRTSADIRVLVVEKDGSTSTLTPISTDDKNGTVTVQASGFSVCVPTAPQGMPRLGAAARGGLKPGGDEYWALFLSYEMDDSGPGNDSRSRQFHLDVGDGSFFGDGTFQVSTQERQVTLDDPNDGSGGVTGTVQSGTQSNSATGTFTYAADGQSIQLAPGGGDVPVLRVSKSGEAMVGTSRGSNNRRAEMDFLLRKNTATLSVASLSGTWNLGGVEFDGHGNMGPADLKMKHLSGTFAFDGKGGVRIAVSDRKSQFDTGAGRGVPN